VDCTFSDNHGTVHGVVSGSKIKWVSFGQTKCPHPIEPFYKGTWKTVLQLTVKTIPGRPWIYLHSRKRQLPVAESLPAETEVSDPKLDEKRVCAGCSAMSDDECSSISTSPLPSSRLASKRTKILPSRGDSYSFSSDEGEVRVKSHRMVSQEVADAQAAAAVAKAEENAAAKERAKAAAEKAEIFKSFLETQRHENLASTEQQRKDAAASAQLQRQDAEAREAKAEAQLAAAHAMAAQREAALLASASARETAMIHATTLSREHELKVGVQTAGLVKILGPTRTEVNVAATSPLDTGSLVEKTVPRKHMDFDEALEAAAAKRKEANGFELAAETYPEGSIIRSALLKNTKDSRAEARSSRGMEDIYFAVTFGDFEFWRR